MPESMDILRKAVYKLVLINFKEAYLCSATRLVQYLRGQSEHYVELPKELSLLETVQVFVWLGKTSDLSFFYHVKLI